MLEKLKVFIYNLPYLFIRWLGMMSFKDGIEYRDDEGKIGSFLFTNDKRMVKIMRDEVGPMLVLVDQLVEKISKLEGMASALGEGKDEAD